MWNGFPISTSPYPYYSRCTSTRKLCIVGLIASWLLVVFCICFGAIRSRSPNLFIYLDKPIYVDLVVLVQNTIITICNESLGFIHSTSLKWTLQREGRLEFNSNLRLFSRSRTFGPNAWYGNFVVLFGMISAYAASSLTLIPFSDEDEEAPDRIAGFLIAGSAFMGLGIVMALQASIATWAILSSSNIATWSSNFLDTVAAAIALSPELKDRPSLTPSGIPPRERQPSAYSGNKEIRHTIWALWFCVALSCIWSISLVITNRSESTTSWNLFSSNNNPTILISWTNPENNIPSNTYPVFFLTCLIQATLTMTLHCAELHVNCFRDEISWRSASSPHGYKRNTSALLSMLGSWQCMVLFCFKPVAHWLYSLSFTIRRAGLLIFAPQTVYLTLSLGLLAGFCTVLMGWRFNGRQPVAFGRLRIVVDEIGVWPGKGERLFWREKGVRWLILLMSGLGLYVLKKAGGVR